MSGGVDRVVRRFYTYRVAMAMGFTSSFLVAFLASRGVSFAAVGLGVTALSAVNVVGEVPAGYVGDRWGRRTAMVAASATWAVVGVGWLFARTAPTVVALLALSGAALSLQSGAATSWLYEALDEYDAADRYSAVASRSISLLRGTQAVTALVGAGLFVLSPTYPFLASALAGVGAIAATLALPATERFREEPTTGTGGDADGSDERDGHPGGERVGPLVAARAMRSFVAKPAVRTVVAFSAVFASAVVVAGRFVQPVVDDAVREHGLVVATLDVPGVVVLGVVGAAYTAASAVAVDHADALAARVGRGPAIAGAYGACAVAMLAPLAAWYGPVGPVAAAAVAAVVFQSLPSVAGVVRNAYLHEHAASLTRATTMSAVALASSLVRMPVVLAGGVVADAYAPSTAVVAAGAGALLVGALVVALDGPLTVPNTDEATAPESEATTAD